MHKVFDDDGSVTIEAALALSSLVLVAAGIVGAIATLASYIAAVDMAGAAARAYAIGVEYHPAREDAQVSVEESSGLVRASVSVDAPIGTMRSEAVFPAEVGGNE